MNKQTNPQLKPDLILLHGALGSQTQFKELSELLQNDFQIHSLNFEGHGGRPCSSPFSITLFSQNLIDYIVNHQLFAPFVFGYSMGGYVALHAATQGIDLKKLMTLGTKFDWTPEGAQKEVKLLNPVVIEEKIPKYAAYQAKLHAPEDWKTVMIKTAEMMLHLGSNPALNPEILHQLDLETLCCLGSEDTMVTLEETKLTVAQLKNARLHVFEGFEHPIEKVPLTELSKKIKSFFLNS